MNFQMFMLDLEKAEEPEIKLPTSVGSLRKQESSRKTSISVLLIMPRPFTVWITTNYGKFLKRWKYQTTLPDSWEIYMQDQEAIIRTEHGTTDWFQIRKGVHQGCILSSAYFISMQSTSCKMLGWMKHKLESRLLGEISIISDIQMTPLLWQKAKKKSLKSLKSLLRLVKKFA